MHPDTRITVRSAAVMMYVVLVALREQGGLDVARDAAALLTLGSTSYRNGRPGSRWSTGGRTISVGMSALSHGVVMDPP
jgi:hypothetical protein